MVDLFSISSEFSFNGISISKAELGQLPNEVEFLYDSIISQAKEKSPFFAKCLTQLFDLCDNSVRVLMSNSVRTRIQTLCEKENDRDFFVNYDSLFTFVRNNLQVKDDRNTLLFKALLEVFENKLLQNDVDLIRNKAKLVGHFPLYLTLDRYLQNLDSIVKEFVDDTSFIYYSGTRKEKTAKYLKGDALKAYKKLKEEFDTIIQPIRRYFNEIDKIYKNLLYTEINNDEGTDFSQSFVYWVQCEFGGACYLGDINASYPSWCFSHWSVEICYPNRSGQLEAFKNLYSQIANIVSEHRDKAIVLPLESLLQYEEETRSYRFVYKEDSNRYEREKIPNQIRRISITKSVKEETKRIIRSIGKGLSIEATDLIIPPGDAILIKQAKKAQPKVSIKERRLKYEEKRKRRELADKAIVEGSPIIERFIKWAKKQTWYSEWATLYQNTFNEDPDRHLHSLAVARALNNSIPGRELYNVLYHFEFFIGNYSFCERLKLAENGFITSDRRAKVLSLVKELSSTKDGLLLKTATEIFELFGLDAPHVTSGLYLLSESLDIEGLGYAPTNYKNYICIYKLPTKGKNLIHSSWRWMDTYSAQLSLLRIAAQICKDTAIEGEDLTSMRDFLSKHKVDTDAQQYLMACFMVYFKEEANNDSYDFSYLGQDEKADYLSFLERFSQDNDKRTLLLEKYKNLLV